MLYWIPVAFVRISVFFVGGILAAHFLPTLLAQNVVALLLTVLFVLYVVTVVFNHKAGRVVVNPGLLGLMAVFFSGYLNLLLRTESNSPAHFSNLPRGETILCYSGTVVGFRQEKEKNWKHVLELSMARTATGWKPVSGKVLLYLPKKYFDSPLGYGDVLLVKGSPVEVPAPSNPGEFDYKQFLLYRNITHQHFVKGGSLKRMHNDPPSQLLRLCLSSRDWAERTLKKVVAGPREQAIACALVLGITDGLDHELMDAYAATGAMHVLSVSGLHVGILYLILMFFLKPLQKLRHGMWMTAIISLALLWIYAGISGLSPSVLRAVTMFSFLSIAKPLGRRTNIYNIIGASAFLLLLFDPYLIMSVGFQLSYLALIGIVYVQPLVYRMYEAPNRVVTELWKVTSVSIAAQLSTFPLGLFYFHQFPNYFLLSNFYVLPLGFAILTLGIFILMFSLLSFLATLLGVVLTWSIKLLNYLTFLTEGLPCSVIDGVRINLFQCFMIMLIIVMVVVFFERRKIALLYCAVFLTMLCAASHWIDYYRHGQAKVLAVYKLSKISAFDLIESGTAFSFCDSSLLHNPTAVSYHVQPNRLIHFAGATREGTKEKFCHNFPGVRVIVWNGIRLMQIHSRKFHLPPIEKVDYLIVSNNSIGKLQGILDHVECSRVIVDSSNSFKFADKLLRDAALNNSTLHSVWHHGAFIKTF
jgi:competence protein ComEC